MPTAPKEVAREKPRRFDRLVPYFAVAYLLLWGMNIGYNHLEARVGISAFYFAATVSALLAIGFMGVAIRTYTIQLREAQDTVTENDYTVRALIRSSPLAIITTDLESRVTMWNEAAATLFGWTDADVVSGPLPIVPPEEQAAFSPLFEKVRRGETVTEVQLKGRKRDLTLVEVGGSLAPLRGAQGQVMGVLLMLADITGRSRFLQIAAHELRNPIASLKAVLALHRHRLKSGRNDPEKLAQMVDVAEQQADHLTALLTQILEAFSVQQGRMSVQREHIQLSDVVGAALGPFQLEYPDRVVVRGLDEGSVWVYADPHRLQDVVGNLVGNALKYSCPRTRVTLTTEVKPDGFMRLSVWDEGRGIPEDQLERIFEPFTRLVSVETADPGGIGLGLYICRDVVQEHGGRIWAESREGRGSAFHLELPVADPPVNEGYMGVS